MGRFQRSELHFGRHYRIIATDGQCTQHLIPEEKTWPDLVKDLESRFNEEPFKLRNSFSCNIDTLPYLSDDQINSRHLDRQESRTHRHQAKQVQLISLQPWHHHGFFTFQTIYPVQHPSISSQGWAQTLRSSTLQMKQTWYRCFPSCWRAGDSQPRRQGTLGESHRAHRRKTLQPTNIPRQKKDPATIRLSWNSKK